MAKTTMRGFRSPASIYEPAQMQAEDKGEDMTTVLNRYLKRYGAAKLAEWEAKNPSEGRGTVQKSA